MGFGLTCPDNLIHIPSSTVTRIGLNMLESGFKNQSKPDLRWIGLHLGQAGLQTLDIYIHCIPTWSLISYLNCILLTSWGYYFTRIEVTLGVALEKEKRRLNIEIENDVEYKNLCWGKKMNGGRESWVWCKPWLGGITQRWLCMYPTSLYLSSLSFHFPFLKNRKWGIRGERRN